MAGSGQTIMARLFIGRLDFRQFGQHIEEQLA